MQYKTCLFCKRSMEQFCYSIYDPDNQPYLNIVQLFGDVEESLRHGRYICHECLYIIRWVYFMKKILQEALLDDDKGENDKVIPAFKIFKVKLNQPIYVLDEDDLDDECDNEVDELSSKIQSLQCQQNEESNESDSECRTPRNPQDYVFFKGTQNSPGVGTIHGNSNSSKLSVSLADGNSNWWPTTNTVQESNIINRTDDDIECAGRDNRLYTCSIKVCEYRSDTFDGLKEHCHKHHLSQQVNLTLENYETNLQAFNKTHSITTNSRRKKYRCLLTQCKKTFKTIESLSEHKVKEHDLMAKYCCVECFNLSFVLRDDLNQHTLLLHQNNIVQRSNEYSCKYCDKYFLEKNLLSAHQLKNHHQQFFNQIKTNSDINNRFIKKVLHNSTNSRNCNQNEIGNQTYNKVQPSSSSNKVCSFKMRQQKVVFNKRSDIFNKQNRVFVNWLRFKYPHLNSNILSNNFQKTTFNSVKLYTKDSNSSEKVVISLPPRKRRQYQFANECLPTINTNVVNNDISQVTNFIDQVRITNVVVNKSQIKEDFPKISDLVINNAQDLGKQTIVTSNDVDVKEITPKNVTECTKNEVKTNESKLFEDKKLIRDQEQMVDTSTNVVDDVNALKGDKLNISIHENKILPDLINLKANSIKDLSLENSESINNEESTLNLVSKAAKTYNYRKRKTTHQKGKSNNKKTKTKELTEPIENQMLNSCLDSVTESKSSNGSTSELPPECSSLKTATDCDIDTFENNEEQNVIPMISKIEEKDNDNTPGRITMTISLKAIKQYTNHKEVKRESKRQKKLKEKKKNKTLPIDNDTNEHNVETIDIVCPTNSDNDSTIKQMICKVPAVVNGYIENKLNSNEIVEIDKTVDNSNLCSVVTSGGISESEKSENEITLNKDEINMIIFGETLTGNSSLNVKNGNNDNDAINDNVSSVINGDVVFSKPLPSHALGTLQKLPKKKSKPKSRFAKKRKVKRKPEKILQLTVDADGNVIDEKQLVESGFENECTTTSKNGSIDIKMNADVEETVEGQISNVQLKDHLYARSAFNAFKQAK